MEILLAMLIVFVALMLATGVMVVVILGLGSLLMLIVRTLKRLVYRPRRHRRRVSGF